MNNQQRQTYFSLCIFSFSIVTVLIALLFSEYRFFCKQVQELLALKEVYANCIDEVQKKMNVFNNVSSEKNKDSLLPSTEDISVNGAGEMLFSTIDLLVAENSDEVDDDDDYVDDSFVLNNKQPEYLHQSALDYLQEQGTMIMNTVDMGQWPSYVQKKDIPIQPKTQRLIKPVQKSDLQKKSIINRPVKDFGFVWPIDPNKFWLSSFFGPRKRINGSWGFHHGIDMAAVKGTTVKAARAGNVVEACFQAGYGNNVVIEHTKNIKTRYAHLHSLRVHVGQSVRQGAIIGTVGETGFIRKKSKDGSHLHFEVYEKGKRINPLQCLPG